MINPDNNYVVGAGMLYFAAFEEGTKDVGGNPEMYFGNTPELTVSQSAETLDHFGSDSSTKEKDASIDISRTQTGSFTTDNVSNDNLALWFNGAKQKVVVAEAAGKTKALAEAIKGGYYPLGVTDATPMGGKVSGVTVKETDASGDPIDAAGNWEVDLDRGRLHILPDAVDIDDGDPIWITYTVAAHTYEQVISQGKSIYGQLRFESTNRAGENKDHFYPYVKISASGDYALKGDGFQTMTFGLEILKLRPGVERTYILPGFEE